MLKATALSLALLANGLSSQGNVLLIVADDLGVDKVASYGVSSSAPPTPNLDALAADGVRFGNCWSNPLCSPTRATIQTGRYSFRTGVGAAIPLGPPLPQEEWTLAEALDATSSGYGHALVGKWHLGGNGASNPLDPNRQGYDHYTGLLAGAFVGPFGYMLWPKTTNGAVELTTQYATSANVDDALDWIDERSEPWFLCLSFNAPHTPYHAPPHELHSQELGDDPCSDPVPFYDAMVEAMDTEIGRLLSSLDPAVRANTTFLVVGDNGTTGAVVLPPFDPGHGKGSLYQGGVQVPLIVSGAAVVAPGRSTQALVNTTDLFATVLELANADVSMLPETVGRDSISLVPYLQEPATSDLRDYVFAEGFVGAGGVPVASLSPSSQGESCTLAAGAQIAQGQAVRNKHFKLLRFADGREELYNLTLDPRETFDLLGLASLSLPAQAAYAELSGVLADLAGSATSAILEGEDPEAPPMLLRSIQSGGMTRWYRVHEPAQAATGPLPVVLAFHGGGGNARQFADHIDLFQQADEEGFLLVYPEGTGGPLSGPPFFQIQVWNANICCASAVENDIDDVQFARDLVDDLETEWNIDTDRVFATGHSNGAMMSYRLGVEASDLVRAIAPNAGALGVEGLPSQPVPLMVLHGALDTQVPWQGGQSTGVLGVVVPSQAQSLVPFEEANQTGPWSLVAASGQAYLYRAASPLGAPIEYWWLADGGHSWPGHTDPGGSEVNNDIDANEVIWNFFKRF